MTIPLPSVPDRWERIPKWPMALPLPRRPRKPSSSPLSASAWILPGPSPMARPSLSVPHGGGRWAWKSSRCGPATDHNRARSTIIWTAISGATIRCNGRRPARYTAPGPARPLTASRDRCFRVMARSPPGQWAAPKISGPPPFMTRRVPSLREILPRSGPWALPTVGSGPPTRARSRCSGKTAHGALRRPAIIC